jgi:hypothetical protein
MLFMMHTAILKDRVQESLRREPFCSSKAQLCARRAFISATRVCACNVLWVAHYHIKLIS